MCQTRAAKDKQTDRLTNRQTDRCTHSISNIPHHPSNRIRIRETPQSTTKIFFMTQLWSNGITQKVAGHSYNEIPAFNEDVCGGCLGEMCRVAVYSHLLKWAGAGLMKVDRFWGWNEMRTSKSTRVLQIGMNGQG